MSDRRCYRDHRCRDRENDNGRYLGAPIHTEQGLCLTCTRIVTDAIAELPRDYVDLSQALDRGTVTMGDLVAATKELPAPIRISVAALRSEIVHVATTWAEPVADRLSITWDTQGMALHTRPGWALQRATTILTGAPTVLLSLQAIEVQTWDTDGWVWECEPADGIDGALDLLRLHHVTRSALGRTKLVHQLPAPCPDVDCGAMALVRHDGSAHVDCEHCGRRWSEQDYRRLTLILAADVRGAAA